MWLEVGTGGIDFSVNALGVNVVLGVDLSTIIGLVVVVAGLRIRKIVKDKRKANAFKRAV